MSASFPHQCKLLNGTEILDDACTCTFMQISRESPFAGKFSGEGWISLSKPWPFTLREMEPRQFTLRFDRVLIPGIGELEDIPILLIPGNVFGNISADFQIVP